MDKTLQQSEVTVLRKQLERKALRRNVLEGVIIHKMCSRLALDWSAKYTALLGSRLRERGKALAACVPSGRSWTCRSARATRSFLAWMPSW